MNTQRIHTPTHTPTRENWNTEFRIIELIYFFFALALSHLISKIIKFIIIHSLTIQYTPFHPHNDWWHLITIIFIFYYYHYILVFVLLLLIIDYWFIIIRSNEWMQKKNFKFVSFCFNFFFYFLLGLSFVSLSFFCLPWRFTDIFSHRWTILLLHHKHTHTHT